jgi:NhaP-type Na+/H+ or K+/H+ antiporter
VPDLVMRRPASTKQPMITTWFIIAGLMLILMGLVGSVIERLPLSTGLLYLVIGYALGPSFANLLVVDPLAHSVALERVFEIAVLISLFTLGLKLRLPFPDPLWRIPLRLATVSMFATVAGIAALAVALFDLPLAAAILLGGILAPTDPVLASDVQIKRLDDRDRVRFGLTAEGGMNDGTAFPIVFLGLGLLGLRDTGPFLLRWFGVDLLWGVCGGLAIGWLCGLVVGRLVVFLRRTTNEPIGLEEFLILGLVALSYGVALLTHALGFLAVLAAGLAVRHIERHETARVDSAPRHARREVAEQTEPARAVARGLLTFNERFERIAELVAVLLLGGLLSAGYYSWEGVWLAALVLLLVRPLSVLLGLLGVRTGLRRVALLGWFGIRGVGSLYYLMFVIGHGLPAALVERLLPLVLTVVAVSIVIHGISATPLMNLYVGVHARGTRLSEDKVRGDGEAG